MDSEIFDKFYNKALKFLSYRPRSEKEVVKNLLKKKAPEDIIKKIIVKLKEQKFLDDREFIKWWITSRLTYRPRSINLIRRELLQKGINKELIDAQIPSAKGADQISNELENAQKLIEKRLNRYKNLSREEKFQKISRFLASKGFDYDTIKEIFKDLK